MVLEALRRAAKEYDAFLIRKGQRAVPSSKQDSASNSVSSGKNLTEVNHISTPFTPVNLRPTFVEQAMRALLHVLQFAVAYFIMLLAMYYNGYIIICIFIGAYMGAFIFGWTNLGSR